jgi:hypothetical protein
MQLKNKKAERATNTKIVKALRAAYKGPEFKETKVPKSSLK